MSQHSKKQGFIHSLAAIGAGAVRAERARLEAFLDAVPGEYCGWARDGTLAYSEGFCALLGLESIRDITDLQNALWPGDAAALDGLFARLKGQGDAFSLTVRTADRDKTLKLSGRRGSDTGKDQQFDVLWLEDISAEQEKNVEKEYVHAAVEEERNRLQAALDHLPAPLWMRDSKTEISWCNRAYALAVDASPATVIAEQRELSLKPLKKQGNRETGRLLAQTALDSGKPETMRGHLIIGGRRHMMEIQEIPLPQSGMTLGVARNVSREEELESIHKRYMNANNELLEHLGTAIGIFDATQKLEFYNTAFGQLWHLEETYLNTGPRLGDLMEKLRESRRLPEQADFRKYKHSWLSMFTGLITPHDEMLYLPDGSAIRMLVVPHTTGGLMMTFEDVTGRLELESSYNTLVAVQKETLDNLAEGVSVYGGDGRLRLWNPSFARLWKLNPEELEGKPHINRLIDKMKGRFSEKGWDKAKTALTMQSLDRNTHEGRMECADGNIIAYSTVPLPDGGVLVTHVDITDKMRVENALREKNAALEAAERLKLDFLANVSYQLRTPLNAMMGFAEILDNEYFGSLNDRQKEYTKGMEDAGEMLLGLINNILDLSTLEAGYMEFQHETVSVHALLQDIYALTGDWARRQRLTVRLECPDTIGDLDNVDERRLKQALLNLMRNAIAFTPEKGTITIRARRAKDVIRISVSDTGPGIPEKDRERIFEPFERAQPGSQGRGGAGLGLTLVKNIIAMHKGTVSLESEEGKGTTVTIALPLPAGEKPTPPKKQAGTSKP